MPNSHHQPVGHAQRAVRHHQAGGQVGQADLERAVPEHLLEVERGKEEPGEHGACPQHADDLGDRDVAELEQTQRDQRVLDAGLADHEGDHQRGSGREQAERLTRRPAGLVAADHGVHGDHQGERDQPGARHVETLATVADLVGGQHPTGRDPDADADGDVDQEDPVPVEQAGEDAPGEHADCSAARHHEPEEAHRLRPLGRVGEQAHDQGECDRGHGSAAQPLDGAADDEEGEGSGRARRRCWRR